MLAPNEVRDALGPPVQSIVAALCVAIVAVLLVTTGVWMFQRFGVYRFSQVQTDPATLGVVGLQVLKYRGDDGADLEAWFLAPQDGQPLLISFSGNFAAVGGSFERMRPFFEQGYGIAMPVYRGSSGSAGRPSEEVLLADGRALYDQLEGLTGLDLPAERRVIHGFSLGAGLATRLASERPARALVLEAGCDTLCRYFQARFRIVPLCALMWSERYDAARWIGSVRMPMLMGHGGRDQAILPSWGRRLYEVANPPKAWRCYPLAGHADLLDHGFAGDVTRFLADPTSFAQIEVGCE